MKPKSSGLAPDQFIKQIKNGQIPTVVCIVGEEPYYRDLARRTLLDAIFTDTPPDSRDITVFEEKTDMKKLDTLINTYLEAAASEILGWRYSYSDYIPQSVPKEYEMTQVQAVVNGYTQSGNEGQNVSIENGIHRHFAYSDMVRYIRANVIAIAKVGAGDEA